MKSYLFTVLAALSVTYCSPLCLCHSRCALPQPRQAKPISAISSSSPYIVYFYRFCCFYPEFTRVSNHTVCSCTYILVRTILSIDPTEWGHFFGKWVNSPHFFNGLFGGVEWSSSNLKVGSLIPSLPKKNLHAEVSLSKMLNPELCLIEQQSAANRCTVWMCVWLGECKTVL